MRKEGRLALAALALAITPVAAQARHARRYLDLPITQTVNRDGAIRYATWIKVGERSVEALIDTGSTGLRVLPSVLPGDFAGVQTDVAFGAGFHMEGLAVKAPVEIGSLSGTMPVEIVHRIRCMKDRPDCDVERLGGENYLIGGDGYPSEGYSAILGIGLPFHETDLGNPLVALGAKRWIVDLPRPYAIATGHLILEPDAAATAGFSLLDRDGRADADGCITGAPLPEPKCGTVLFDTGAPAISVAYDGVETSSAWDNGTLGTISFTSGDKTLKVDFTAGVNSGQIGVGIVPPDPHDSPEPFILAGVTPFFSYDVLYDSGAHTVGLRTRTPARPMRQVADQEDR